MEALEGKLLKIMYQDPYFPNDCVDKIKAILVSLILDLDEMPAEALQDTAAVQARLDQAIRETNEASEYFDENGSEIETVGRESIADSVYFILKHFNIEIDLETAIRMRDW
eukprot:GCRY01002138.1.p1 GENE.GCRY01002138.1~~GCRY01002138.1.p1  ORF type:complete len:111 (+),score=15.55 GCRY01002138.1:214-546(+)